MAWRTRPTASPPAGGDRRPRPRRSPCTALACGPRGDHAGQDLRPRQPPDGRPPRPPRRAAARGRGGVPGVEIHVRGNEIAITGRRGRAGGPPVRGAGPAARAGQRLEPAAVSRTIEMVRADERPSEVLTTEVLPRLAGPHGPPQVGRAEALRRRHPRQRHHLRHRPRRHRQVVAGGGHGGAGAAGQGGRPHHPHPPGRRGGRAAGLPARRPGGQDRPLPAPLYDALFDMVGPREPSAWSTGARSRWRRWPSCGAARSTTASSSSTRRRTRRPSR